MDDQQLRDFVWNALPRMENSNPKVSPYQASYAELGNSGLSFGHMQLDVSSGNKIALQCFENIMMDQIDKKYKGKKIAKKHVIKIISDAKKKGNNLDSRELGIVNQALDANHSAINKADEKQFEKVMGDLEVAFAAAGRNPNGPGELNRIAPNPYLITELAAWANMNSTGLIGKTDNFLSGKTNPTMSVSMDNYDTYCFHNTKFWKTEASSNFKANWPGRILDATTYAEGKIGATVTNFSALGYI